MLKNLMIPKEKMICISETMNCLDAIEILEDNNLRNAPVVDATGNMYRGNIYRYHIYKYKFHHPEADLSQLAVTFFLKNTTKTIIENDSILHLVFLLKDLPFIAVLSEQNSFMGVIYHETFLDYLQQAWVMGRLSCVLAIKSKGFKGDLRKVSQMINRFCDIGSAMTLEASDYNTSAYILYGLPYSLDQLRLKSLLQYLRAKNYEFEVYPL